jgi:hypothetical protein
VEARDKTGLVDGELDIDCGVGEVRGKADEFAGARFGGGRGIDFLERAEAFELARDSIGEERGGEQRFGFGRQKLAELIVMGAEQKVERFTGNCCGRFSGSGYAQQQTPEQYPLHAC